MQIQHKQAGRFGTFYIEENGLNIAEMTYKLKDENTMVIKHTEVDEKLRGKNIGLELVKRGVEFARSEKLKVVAECVFAKSTFERKKELQDVLL